MDEFASCALKNERHFREGSERLGGDVSVLVGGLPSEQWYHYIVSFRSYKKTKWGFFCQALSFKMHSCCY